MKFGDDKNKPESPWGKKTEKKESNEEFDIFLKDSQTKFRKMFNDGGSSGKGPNFPTNFNSKKMLGPIIALIFFFWLGSGFFTVQEGEEAAVIRLGKFTRVALTGLNYHLPYPFETMIKRRVDQIEREEIGFKTSTTNKKGGIDESLMLTGDENIVDINFVIQWRIRDIKDFLFNINRPAETVKASAEAALREVIANTPIASALAEGKFEIERKGKELLQGVLDSYNIGVEIVTVQMLKADPPQAVIDAFRDVQTARADKEREINQGETYRNDIIPRARGQVEGILQSAEAYKQEVIAIAEGESARFLALYNQYKNSKDVTAKRIYIEAMEDILQNVDKVVMDSKGAVPYLPMDKLLKSKPTLEQKEAK